MSPSRIHGKPKAAQILPLRRLLTRVRQIVWDTVRDDVSAFAEAQKDAFQLRIQEQRFTAFQAIPLSESWLARKAAKGADLRTMIATGHYVDHIQVFPHIGRMRGTWRIGFHPGAHARDLDGQIAPLLLNEVALIQEHGSVKAHIPARPHWGPHRLVIQVAARARRRVMRKKALQAVREELGAQVEVRLP